MAEIFIIALCVVAFFVIISTVLLFKLLNRKSDNNAGLELQQKMQEQMQSQINSLREELARTLQDGSTKTNEQMNTISNQLNERMKETTNVLNNTQSSVGSRLDSAAQVIGQLQSKLGNMEESNKKILDVGQGIKDLKDILKSPKLRGNMGEFFLEDLLRQILPANNYKMQYTFKTGDIVDATINLGNSFVCVDSKFPLETFVRMQQTPDDREEQKKREKKDFVRSIKKHASAIAKKYILPDEGTFDFAFMYIPAENVYYETIIRDDLMDDEGSLHSWLLDKRVIPVSPNSLYAYLQVIVLGLKGMRIQENAKQMLQRLDRLAGDLDRFRSDYNVLGKHIKNATNSYESSHSRLEKFSDRYYQLSTVDSVNLENGDENAPHLNLDN